ncbi:MAG: hypothetical protein JST00_29410 [Deltaproteobacteria bacterium]|nr:hypothetical protein [Deltaproteobacteria bacterium]
MTARALAAVALVLCVFGVAWATRSAEGKKALLDADTALARGDAFDAIMAARAAAEAQCPMCTAPAEGYARLERIAKDAEGRGDDATAFAAWGAYRAAVLATAGASASERRTKAETEIARFGHRMDAAAVVAGAPPTAAAADDKLRAALAAHDVPGGATFAILAAGAVIFVWSALRFVTAQAAKKADLVAAAAGIAVAIAGAAFF